MNDDAAANVVILVVLMLLAVVFVSLGWAIGDGRAENRTRRDAIEAGCAEWRIDAKTGEESFHWLPAAEVSN